jgi:hypothetical protein
LSQSNVNPEWVYTTVPTKNGIYVKCPHCDELFACRRNETDRFKFCPNCGRPAEKPQV